MPDENPGPDTASPGEDGLQPERTALSWRRTGLALTAGSLAALRILPQSLGDWAMIPAGCGMVLSVIIVAAAHVRYRSMHAAVRSHHAIPTHGGALPALMAAVATVGGVFLLVATLVVATQRL